MSRNRMAERVRKNDDFVEIKRYLTDRNLPFEVLPPTGKGHPILLVFLPWGETVRTTITCTPRGSGNKGLARSQIRATLSKHGFVDPK